MSRETVYEEGEVRVTTGTVEIADKVYTFSELGELATMQRKAQNPTRDIGAPAMGITIAMLGLIMENMQFVGLGFAVYFAMYYFFRPRMEYVLVSRSEHRTFEIYADSDLDMIARLDEAIAQARAQI